MRIALVHDWLEVAGGAEKVFAEFIRLFPQAEVFALVDFRCGSGWEFLKGREVRTSFVQYLPGARRFFRWYMPFFPTAMRLLDLRGFDVVIADSHSVAKGVKVDQGARLLCYCHTPMRYAWGFERRMKGILGWLAAPFWWSLRGWDRDTARRVAAFAANSAFVAARVAACYGRKATVIYPPVDVGFFNPNKARKEDFYLTVSRLVGYKRVDVIIEAFKDMPERLLVVAGDGPEMGRLQRLAGGAENIVFTGALARTDVRAYLRRAKAFVFAAEEDFGIAPVEAMACGTPVIAFERGGVRETVVAGETGVFFEEQTPKSLQRAVERFEGLDWDAAACRARAEVFGAERFRRNILEWVKKAG